MQPKFKVLPLRRAAILAVLLLLCRIAAAEELASSTTVFVKDIKLRGDNIVPQPVLDRLLPRYTNRTVSAEELLDLAQQLTAYLIEQGYINSGVILPDQKIDDGTIYLRVVAGRVARVVVTGSKHLSSRYVASRLGLPSGEPFNMNDAVRRLQLLERDPRIKKLNAELKPSVERGSALLNVDIEEARAYGASVGFDNHISPNVGAKEAVVDLYHLNLLGFGDSASVFYQRAEGFSGGSVAYSIPLNARDTRLSVSFNRNTSRIVSEPFAQLDIEGTTTRYGVGIRQPLIDSLRSELGVGIGLQRERVDSFLLGEPFSFSVSDENGRSQVTVVQFMQDWVLRSPERVVALRSSFNLGIDALQATVGGEGDGRFLEWLGQGELLQKWSWLDSTFGVKLNVHLSNDTLPSYRKFALGGANSVRGYRENLITRDNGYLVSLAWTVPLFRAPISWLGGAQADGRVTVSPFADYGYGWDHVEPAGEHLDLASIGFDIQWRMGRNSSVDLQLAKGLIEREIPAYDKVLQDDGVHFGIRLGF